LARNRRSPKRPSEPHIKVGHGYILGLPVAAYLTWQGRMLENNGIGPKISIELSRDSLKEGRDTQLETAIDVANAL
jgi:C-terminal processing protease CtpA/Prc